MKKCLAILLLILVTLSCTVYGADVTSDTESVPGKVVLSGTADGHADGEFVAVHAFKKENYLVSGTEQFDKTAAYNALAETADKRSVLAYHDQMALSGGKFKFTIKISGTTPDEIVSGVYTALITVGGVALDETDFLYIDSDEQKEAFLKLAALKQEGTETRYSSLVKLLEENPYTLGFYCELLKSVSESEVYKLFYNYLEGVNYDVSDNVTATQNFRKLIVIEALNEGKIDSIGSYEQELLIADGEMADWYGKSFVNESLKKAVTDRLKNKKFSGLAAYDAAFKEALILEYNVKADGLDTVKSIVSSFAEDIADGFKPTAYSDAAYRSIMGKRYESYDKMVSALSSYSSGGLGSSGSSGGGGGGGISSGKGASVVSSGSVSNGLSDIASKESSGGFADLGTVSWAEEAITYLAEHGVVAGKTATEFYPNDSITREEFVKILVKALGFMNGEGTLPFNDVAEDAWYYDCIRTAYHNEIVKGITSDTFGVSRPVTRQDMSVMLYEALRKKGIELKAEDEAAAFNDEALIADYAKEAVKGLQAAGVINGLEDGCFNPAGYTTRAEAAKVIYGVLSLLY